MRLHLVDATYELFRAHFAPRPPVLGRDGIPLSGVSGLCDQLLYLLREEGATHVGCATDRVIESFRNDLYPGYKSSAGMPPELLAQFPIAEAAVRGARHRPVADGRVRGGRRDRRGGRPLRRRPAGRADPRVHARTRTWPSSSSTTASCCWDRRRRNIVYDDAGRPREVGRGADIDPGLAGRSSATARTATRACPAGVPSPPRPSWRGTATWRTIPERASAWEVPGVGGGRAVSLAATLREHWQDALLYRDLARLRTVEDGVPIRQRNPTSCAGTVRRATEWDAFCDEWGLDRLRQRPHRWARART